MAPLEIIQSPTLSTANDLSLQTTACNANRSGDADDMAVLNQEQDKQAVPTDASKTMFTSSQDSANIDSMKLTTNDNESAFGSKLLPAPSETDRSRPSDNGGNVFCNVHYSDCNTDSTLTFTDCQLENVHFIHCKFKNTQFCHVKLANVVFINIDLDNVTLLDANLEGHSWKNVIVRNTVLSQEKSRTGPERRTTSLKPYKPLARSQDLPFLVIENRGVELLSPGALRRLWQYEKSFRHSVQVDEILRPDLLARLMDHEHIMSRVIDSLVSKLDEECRYAKITTLHIWDRTFAAANTVISTFVSVVMFWDESPSKPTKLGESVSLFCPSVTGDGRLAAMSLFHINRTVNERPTGLCRGPLPQTKCHAYRHLYRTVNDGKFFDSDVQCEHLRTARVVVLHYDFESGNNFIQTDDKTWRDLMCYLRHAASYIPEIRLIVGKKFWDLANWDWGAKAVLDQRDLRGKGDYCGLPNFLATVAKIAAPADRWCVWGEREVSRRNSEDYDPKRDRYYCAHGTRLQIIIDDTVSDEQKAFVTELTELVNSLREGRPLFRWYSRRSPFLAKKVGIVEGRAS